MRRILLVISICVLLTLSACKSGGVLDELSNVLGVDLRGAVVESDMDTHGGFHGDGRRFVSVDCSAASLTEEMLESSDWRALPLTKNLTILVYGVTVQDSWKGSYLTDENGEALFPPIANGFYYFIDRQNQGEHRRDDTDVFSRNSLNVTVAIYDTDTDALYFAQLDT